MNLFHKLLPSGISGISGLSGRVFAPPIPVYPEAFYSKLLFDTVATRMMKSPDTYTAMLSQADGGGGTSTLITVTAPHGLTTNDVVLLQGTVSYNGAFNVLSIPTATTFTVAAPFVSNDASGYVDKLATASVGELLAGWFNGSVRGNNAWQNNVNNRYLITANGLQSQDSGDDLRLNTAVDIPGEFSLYAVFERAGGTNQVPIMWQSGGFNNGVVFADDANLYISFAGGYRSLAFAHTGLISIRIRRDVGSQFTIRSSALSLSPIGTPLSGTITGLNQIFKQNSNTTSSAARLRHVSLVNGPITGLEDQAILDWITAIHGVGWAADPGLMAATGVSRMVTTQAQGPERPVDPAPGPERPVDPAPGPERPVDPAPGPERPVDPPKHKPKSKPEHKPEPKKPGRRRAK